MEAESCFGSLKNLKGFDISFDQNLSVVPKSLGFLPDQDWEIALVIFFPDGNREKRARSFIIEMREKEVCNYYDDLNYLLHLLIALIFTSDNLYSLFFVASFSLCLLVSINCEQRICNESCGS